VSTSRLEAFSDGVIAILITIMVLELKTPEAATWDALSDRLPIFLAYLLSFVNLGIYWNNHHHMLQATGRVSGSVLWANLHLLFWLSMFPFITAWIAEFHRESVPVAVYGMVALLAGAAYNLLENRIVALEGRDSALARALQRDWKGKLSMVLYAAAVALAFLEPSVAIGLYVVVSLMWLVPDPRVARIITQGESPA
jgi:uncharacterized membrane protein